MIFMAVMVGTVILCWIINNSFLENFYIQNKKSAIKDAYSRINEVVTIGDISSEAFDVELRKICDMYNISLLVIDAGSNIVKSSTRDVNKLLRRLYDNFLTQIRILSILMKMTSTIWGLPWIGPRIQNIWRCGGFSIMEIYF